MFLTIRLRNKIVICGKIREAADKKNRTHVSFPYEYKISILKSYLEKELRRYKNIESFINVIGKIRRK